MDPMTQHERPNAVGAMPMILVVEDNPVTSKNVRIALQVEGYRVFEARDGYAARTRMAQCAPDLILLDLLLPDIDGVDLVKQLRGMSGGAEIPILAVSGFISRREESRVASAGFTDFLLKPVEPLRLVKAVRDFLVPHVPRADAPGRGRALLLADDDPVQRKLLRLQFAHAGFRVRVACDGAEAFAEARREPPDLIVSDVLMPKLDGFGLCLKLRNDERLFGLPIVLVSANYIEAADCELGEKVGASTFIHRNLGFEPILNAALQSLEQPIPRASSAVAELDAEHHVRIIHQLERQLKLLNSCVQRTVIQSAILHELGVVADTLTKHKDLTSALNEILAQCLDGAGLSKGALYLLEPHEKLVLGAQHGCAEILDSARAHFGASGLLDQVLKADEATMIPSAQIDAALAEDFLQRARSKSALLAPVRYGEKGVGVLLLLSLHHQLIEEDWFSFGRALAAQIGQSVALSRTYCQLSESEQRFRQLAENIQEAFFLANPTFTEMLYMSPAYETLWGRSCESLYAEPQSWTGAIFPDDRAAVLDNLERATTTGQFDIEYRIVRPDASLRWIRVRGFPICDEAGAIYRVAGIAENITERKEQQDKITRLNRIHAVLSGINSAIVRIGNRDELLQEVCRVAVTAGAFNMAWIGAIDPQTLDGRVVAWYGNDPGYVDKIRLTARVDTPDSNRPACRAVRLLQPVICNDISADSTLAPLSDDLLEGGHQSLACFPLFTDERAVAVLALFASEIGVFDEQECKLLTGLANDVSFGLQFIHKKERLSYLAYYDSLTGLPNGELFHDRLTQLLNGAAPDKGIVAVIVIDLDNFTHLNDAFGRPAGDALLKQVGERLTGSLWEPCSIARISSDTFAIAVADVQQIAEVASILQKQILEPLSQPFTWDNRQIPVSVRAGIALHPGDGMNAQTLFKNAEAALMKAKSLRESFLFYAPQMNAAITAKLALESELRIALEAKQFVIYFQPRVDLTSGWIVGAEALIRWRHPERGMVPPLQFIPLAEETGLIVPIGDWAIDAVCEQQAVWLARDIGVVPVAVNLSAIQLQKGQLLQNVRGALAKYGLQQKYLELELTESILMKDPEAAAASLQALKDLGLRLSLDDFGTGYSSLAYLKRFPFDFVKIDRSFVTNITHDPDDAAIATAIIAMAHRLNLRVVAEGVETEGQLNYLRQHGCDEFQGYYFSPAVAADTFEGMLRDGKRLTVTQSPTELARTVLLVDDDPDALFLLKHMLQNEGYHVLVASSGEEGLGLLATNLVQVIVSDQHMPRMLGSQFLKIAKSLYPATIGIILSGHADLDMIVNSVNEGNVSKFLAKQWDDDLLLQHIRDAFRSYRPIHGATCV
ncbi:MAG TPA: EAL domain-containing protein [Burkholderiales bacterium]|nr:EAL domain-containing protein [Burkholderiales bacterium]